MTWKEQQRAVTANRRVGVIHLAASPPGTKFKDLTNTVYERQDDGSLRNLSKSQLTKKQRVAKRREEL